MRVLATQPLPGPAWAELGEVEYLDAPIPEGLAGNRPGVGALVVAQGRVDAAVLDLLPDVVLVANYGVGYDNIDVAECARRGVAVSNTPGAVDAATADLAMGLLIACRRRIVEGDRLVRAGGWPQAEEEPVVGEDVSGATLGIVGLGRIGTAVARRARAFEMELLHTSRTARDPALEGELGVRPAPLDELLERADVVTLHAPLSPSTQGLIGAGELARMPDGATLVNTARGGLVVEPALVAELRSGRLRAGLDVFAHEPDVPAELRDLPNVVLTPHIGTASTGTREAMTGVVVQNVLAAAAGRPIPNPVTVG